MAYGTGPITTENRFPCRTLVASLGMNLSPAPWWGSGVVSSLGGCETRQPGLDPVVLVREGHTGRGNPPPVQATAQPNPTQPNNPPPPLPTGGVGERCSPQGPVSSEVTNAQRAHRELRSLECSWGREVLSTPQDLPSTVCSATCDPLGQSRSATGHMPRAPLWGSVVGWRKPQVTRPTDSPSSHSVGLPCPAAGARSTGHTHPPPHANRRTAAQWRQKVATVP